MTVSLHRHIQTDWPHWFRFQLNVLFADAEFCMRQFFFCLLIMKKSDLSKLKYTKVASWIFDMRCLTTVWSPWNFFFKSHCVYLKHIKFIVYYFIPLKSVYQFQAYLIIPKLIISEIYCRRIVLILEFILMPLNQEKLNQSTFFACNIKIVVLFHYIFLWDWFFWSYVYGVFCLNAIENFCFVFFSKMLIMIFFNYSDTKIAFR